MTFKQLHQRRNESGMPLGGIGAGKIEFCRDGRFTNVTINNNWDCPIIDGHAMTPPMPRILEGFRGSVLENAIRRKWLFSPEGLPGAWLAVHNPVDGAHLLKTHARPAFKTITEKQIHYKGRFPLASVEYPSFQAVHLELSAFSSFMIVDSSEHYHDSSLPLALFVFHLRNTSEKRLPASLAMSWQNLNGIGGYAGHPINEPDATPPVFRQIEGLSGLWFDHDPASQTDGRVLGNYSLQAWSDHPAARLSWHAGWDSHAYGHDVWQSFTTKGEFDNLQGNGDAGALAIHAELEAGETMTVVFSLAWYMPHLLAAETDWTHLVRPSSAPPPPVTPNRPDYGHVYQRWYRDSWEIAAYGLRHWQDILERIQGWQKELSDSSLPKTLVDGLCNDLFPFYACAWYTRQLYYAMNESPTDMNGCLGTLDQRGVGNGAVAALFPLLNRAELDLFARDQIGDERDPRHFSRHFNARNGRFDLIINTQGAILHDVGWDHLEGGRTGDAKWLSSHWPELTSLFTLQCYQYACWSGDRQWLDERYPQIKEALRFQARLDQDDDGIPDLWGPGSCTYDTELYPYFGASPYVASLYLAALKVAKRLAEEHHDDEFVAWAKRQYERARQTMETEMWDEEMGYYLCWRDNNYLNWQGLESAHEQVSRNCHISQLAGEMWAEILDLGNLIDIERRERAIASIANRNVRQVPGAAADEFRPDGSYSQSMVAFVMGYFANLAITIGQADAGWEAVSKIYRCRYELDGSLWDTPLQWSHTGNESPQWGRWYFSIPASWYVLWALSGVRLNRLNHTLWLAPSWPASWGECLEALPVYLPDLHARVDAIATDRTYQVRFQIQQTSQEALQLQSFGVRIPSSLLQKLSNPRNLRLPEGASCRADGLVTLSQQVFWQHPGDGLDFSATLIKMPDGTNGLEVNLTQVSK